MNWFDILTKSSEEMRRIRAAGGFVEFNRVNGTLALSRALGDFEFKCATRPPKDQMVTGVFSQCIIWVCHVMNGFTLSIVLWCHVVGWMIT